MDLTKFCQSCAMPLTEQNRCTKNNGEVTCYCNYCLDGEGNFRQPDLTFEQMHALGIQGMDKAQGNRFSKWLSKKSYKHLLKMMDRWK